MAEPSAIKRHQASSNRIKFYQIRFSFQMFTSFHFRLNPQCLKPWHLGGCCWSPIAILVLHIQVPSPSLGWSCFEKALGGKGAPVQWMHLLLAVRNVASRLVWWVGIVTSFSKIILNQCNCWAGSVLCQVCFF